MLIFLVCVFFLFLIPLLRAKSSTSQRWLLCTSRIRLNLLWMSVRTSTPPSWTASLHCARRRRGCCKAKSWLPELVINATLQLRGDSRACCCPPRWSGWKVARRKDGSQPVRGSKVYWNPWRTTNQRKTKEGFRIEAVFLYLFPFFLSLVP